VAKKAYKFRFYPSAQQKQVLAQTFGCVRFIFNWGLTQYQQHFKATGKGLSYSELAALLVELKQDPERAWLAEVSAVPLQQALRHLDKAFTNFFAKRARYPTFKKKKAAQSATFMSNAFKWEEASKSLTLAKLSQPLAIRFSRPLPKGVSPSSVTVSLDSADRYFVSILVEEEIKPKPVTAKRCGVDLGLLDSVTTSHGEKSGNPRLARKSAKRLARAQRLLNRKKLGGANRAKARKKVARIHAQIADRRLDFLHKLTTHLINENQIVCVESLAVKNMLKNPHLAKAIADVGWGELIRQLAYKAEWSGRTLVKIARFSPSSKTCSACQQVVEILPLEIRYWTCPACATTHDRDINAAVNILKEGLLILAEAQVSTAGQAGINACGEPVRPVRPKAKGRGSMKQELSRSDPVEALAL
jgi:putative transposase